MNSFPIAAQQLQHEQTGDAVSPVTAEYLVAYGEVKSLWRAVSTKACRVQRHNALRPLPHCQFGFTLQAFMLKSQGESQATAEAQLL